VIGGRSCQESQSGNDGGMQARPCTTRILRPTRPSKVCLGSPSLVTLFNMPLEKVSRSVSEGEDRREFFEKNALTYAAGDYSPSFSTGC